MTVRENVKAIMAYQNFDSLPLVHFGFWPETLERWRDDGDITPEQCEAWKDSGRRQGGHQKPSGV